MSQMTFILQKYKLWILLFLYFWITALKFSLWITVPHLLHISYYLIVVPSIYFSRELFLSDREIAIQI